MAGKPIGGFRSQEAKPWITKGEEVIAAGEEIDEPTVPVPDDFPAERRVIRLPDFTRRVIEEAGGKLETPVRTSGSTPSAYGEPIHQGKRRGARPSGDDSRKRAY